MKEDYSKWFVLIWNLDIEESLLKMGDGVYIRRLDNGISVFDLAAAGAAGFREWAMLEPFLPACLCEIESAEVAAIEPGYDTLNRAWLASAVLKLKGFSAHLPLACSSYSWDLIGGHQERTREVFEAQLREEGIEAAVYSPDRALPAFKGQLLELHTKLLVAKNAKTKLTKEDAEWINDNYGRFNYLAAESEAFRFALSAAANWQYASGSRMAIAQLWSGIEAVLGISSELVYRISLQVASVLEERGAARRDRFKQLKKLYAARSKAVHGEELSEDRLNEAMVQSSDILNRLLLINIERGRPLNSEDFEEAILG
jgi:hypothetical protein